MEETLRQFHTQFSFDPDIVHKEKWSPKEKFVVAGMGGSGHSTDLLKAREPRLEIHLHRNYDVPVLAGELHEEHAFIASSYSGNTEETVDFAHHAYERGYQTGGISTGGKLLSFLQEHALPHIVTPDTGIEPRSAQGFSIVGIAKLLGQDELVAELQQLAHTLNPSAFEERGRQLAGQLSEKVPVVYASERNRAIANNWKIKFNETGKIPAYFDVFPELNHNEINGFDHVAANEHLAKHFHFIFITDAEDHVRVQKRMAVTQEMYKERDLPVTDVSLEGTLRFERIFNALLLADWTTLSTARQYGVAPEGQPMVEEFKNRIG